MKEKEWISVKDKMPDKTDMYLVYKRYSSSDYFIRDISVYSSDKKRFVEDNISHWMPLPDIPNHATTHSENKNDEKV